MDSRLFWLALAAFVGAIEGGLIAGILPLVSADLGVTLGEAGQLVLFYALAYALGPPLLALLLGGVGRRRILAWSEFGLAVCALLMVLMPFFEGLVLVRTVLAVVAGTYTGTASTVRTSTRPSKKGISTIKRAQTASPNSDQARMRRRPTPPSSKASSGGPSA